MLRKAIAGLLPSTVVFLCIGCSDSGEVARVETPEAAAEATVALDDHWHNQAAVATVAGRCEDALEILHRPDTQPRNAIWAEDVILANLRCYMAGKGDAFGTAAGEVARDATERYPESSVLAQDRGLVEQTLGDPDGAVKWYERAKQIATENLATSPDGPSSHRDRAVLDQMDRAIASARSGG